MNNILIVDDEIEVCILLQNFLVRKNFKVTYSTTLKEAFRKFESLKPDILILDHNMPDGLGIQHIPEFRQQNPSVRIIIISAMSNLKEEALQNGADHFIEKPISFNTLSSVIGFS